jgi:hypothetical protein
MGCVFKAIFSDKASEVSIKTGKVRLNERLDLAHFSQELFGVFPLPDSFETQDIEHRHRSMVVRILNAALVITSRYWFVH